MLAALNRRLEKLSELSEHTLLNQVRMESYVE